MKCNLPLCSCAMGGMPQCHDFDGKVNAMDKVNELRLKEQATPTQEPVAYWNGEKVSPSSDEDFVYPDEREAQLEELKRRGLNAKSQFEIPLYTHPPLRELTDSDMDEVAKPFQVWIKETFGPEEKVIKGVETQNLLVKRVWASKVLR